MTHIVLLRYSEGSCSAVEDPMLQLKSYGQGFFTRLRKDMKGNLDNAAGKENGISINSKWAYESSKYLSF